MVHAGSEMLVHNRNSLQTCPKISWGYDMQKLQEPDQSR